RPIRKNMPKMRISNTASHLYALHVIAKVFVRGYCAFIYWLGETGPTAARVVFIPGTEQRFITYYIHIQPWIEQIIVSMTKSKLGTILLGNTILLIGQALTQHLLLRFLKFFPVP